MVWSTTKDGITFFIATDPNKKYLAIFDDGTKVQFGSSHYQQYKDRLGMYSHLDHNDIKRRQNYIARHSGIKTKNGSRAINNKKSAAYLSLKYLW